jgi:hypothetical protein
MTMTGWRLVTLLTGRGHDHQADNQRADPSSGCRCRVCAIHQKGIRLSGIEARSLGLFYHPRQCFTLERAVAAVEDDGDPFTLESPASVMPEMASLIVAAAPAGMAAGVIVTAPPTR